MYSGLYYSRLQLQLAVQLQHLAIQAGRRSRRKHHLVCDREASESFSLKLNTPAFSRASRAGEKDRNTHICCSSQQQAHVWVCVSSIVIKLVSSCCSTSYRIPSSSYGPAIIASYRLALQQPNFCLTGVFFFFFSSCSNFCRRHILLLSQLMTQLISGWIFFNR